MGHPAAQNDWEDQDLLTKDLASSLLDDEIDAQRKRLAQIDDGQNPVDDHSARAGVERRLAALMEARDRLR